MDKKLAPGPLNYEEKDWNDGRWMEAEKNRWGMGAGTKD